MMSFVTTFAVVMQAWIVENVGGLAETLVQPCASPQLGTSAQTEGLVCSPL